MNTVKVENCKTLFIGRRGENEVTEVVFDFSEWQAEFGNGVIDLFVKRNGDSAAYPVVLSVDGIVATWLVTATDTNVADYGKAEYVYTVNGKIAKSAIFPFYVGEDIGQASSEPPDPYESWIETLTELGTETQANAQAAAQSASDAADSAASASESAGQAEDSAEDAEAWAVGERNGEPVSEGDPTYENSAKYWAWKAKTDAPVTSVNGEAGDIVLDLDDIPNGETYARATPEQLAQIGTNAEDIADIDAMIPSITSESNPLVNVSFLTNRLTSYRTSAAQDTIDAGKQEKITAYGILKRDRSGNITAAVAGADYVTADALNSYRKATEQDTIDNAQAADIAAINDKIPSTASKNNKLVAWSTFNGQLGTKQAKITANGILKGDGAGGVSAAVAGTDYLAPSALDAYRTAAAQDEIDAAQDADIDDLKSAISALNTVTDENILLRWEQGSLDSNSGSEISSTTKIRTQTIDISEYTSVTFHNTSGYSFRTAWLNSSGAVVKEAAYAAYRTATSVSYGFMQRYGITAVRVVLSKANESAIVPSDGSALTMTCVLGIKTDIDRIKATLSNDYKYSDTDYKQLPLTDVVFSVGTLNTTTGATAAGYRPYTDYINLDNDMIVNDTTYKSDVYIYQTDGTFVSHTGWGYQQYIPYTASRKVRIIFDNSGVTNNSTSPQIDRIINSDIYIGIKRKEEYIEESVNNVLSNMAGQDGNSLNIAFITDLHINAYEAIPPTVHDVWGRTTNGLAQIETKRNIDFVVLGGDYLWNNKNKSTLQMAQNAYGLLQDDFYKFSDRQFALKGNHDDNSITEDVAKMITDSVRYGYLGQQYTNHVVVKYGNIEKSYGYIDFKRQKVRAIFINTVDIPYDNALTYKGHHVTGIGNDQLNFIADALAFSEAGWGVVFFSHHMLVNNATMNPTSDAEGYVTPTHGGDALWGIIQAFKGKTTYSKVSTLTDFNYSVSVDYTNNQSNAVLACISGHTHRDLSATQDGVLMISTTASGYGQTAYDSQGTKITYTAGTVTETAFDVFSFDRVNGTIKASRYGAGQNRNWS